MNISKEDIKLKERSFEIVEKDSLKEFKVEKKINFKDLYFELIGYIESIQLDEPNNASNGFLSEEFIKLDDEKA